MCPGKMLAYAILIIAGKRTFFIFPYLHISLNCSVSKTVIFILNSL